MSLTCFEHPSVHPQEDCTCSFYGISFMHTSKQSGCWQDAQHQAHSASDQTAYMDAQKKYHQTTCTSLPEEEHLDV